MSEPFEQPPVRGFLHRPEGSPRGAIALAHGAGSNCNAPLLVAVGEGLARAGLAALRCDLPFRQARPGGPPRPGDAARDRGGLRAAVQALRRLGAGPVFLGGHSYGGRQATMLAAEDPAVADALLLLAYPLHPPRRPEQLRTAHFPHLRTPALFVQGARDPFGGAGELRAALAPVPAPVSLVEISGAGHDLKRAGVPAEIVKHFMAFVFSGYNKSNRS
jgi:predicted alpha/beta-hydrolase family hydrolase